LAEATARAPEADQLAGGPGLLLEDADHAANTDQQMSLRIRWSSSTSSRIAAGS
jgi:hypothetical protein